MQHSDEILDRIYSRSEYELNSGCLLWTGATTNAGYGKISVRGTLQLAHRVVCEATHGAIGGGHYACHRCDTPSCVNPAHLFPATPTENYRDMRKKGRVRVACHAGQNNPKARLNEEQVREIKLSLLGGEGVAAVARRMGISNSLVSDISLGRSWRSVEVKR